MWEIPVYGMLLPVVTLVFALISSIKFKRYWLAPLSLFIVLNIPTILLPLFHNVGWEALFGWAVFYTVIAFIITGIVWMVHRKGLSSTSA